MGHARDLPVVNRARMVIVLRQKMVLVMSLIVVSGLCCVVKVKMGLICVWRPAEREDIPMEQCVAKMGGHLFIRKQARSIIIGDPIEQLLVRAKKKKRHGGILMVIS